MFEGVAKLCQRQVYSWLSSRCGLPICIIGVLIAIISAFQFGEVFLEWSRERYAVQFSIYADNLAGKSYEKYLSPELPIDIVYTWVNGSDPKLLAELKELKRKLNLKKQDTPSQAAHNKTNTTIPDPFSPYVCPFKHCIPWQSLLLDARNSSNLSSLETLHSLSPLLTPALDCQFINTTGHVTPVYAVRMPTEEDVTKCLKGNITDRTGRRILTTRGFLTSDGSLVGAIRMKDIAVVTSPSIKPANSSRHLRKWMELYFGRNISEVEVKAPAVAMVGFRPGSLEPLLKRNATYRFLGELLVLRQAYLVWMPFSLPDTQDEEEEGNTTEEISASRFQDNEELRYSLRSVERYAPWVRKVFIVTNGQIPSWLNLENPRVTLVSHQDIFTNKSHLPTYSSPSIETHLHRIPGLSTRFIYLNDDVMFGADVWPEDFYTPRRGQKVFLAWQVPHCAEGCPPNWIVDHYCDQACNNSECDWDGGDCVNVTRPGWQPGYHWQQSLHATSDYCNIGCINSWLGDRYCDQSCRVPDCGYDSGDCGTEHWEELYQISPKNGSNYTIPLGTTAMFFNMTHVFSNGTISSAEHTSSRLIRTAVVAQRFKTLSLTFARNVSLSTANFTISGTNGNRIKTVLHFFLMGDTATKNKSLEKVANYSYWSFPNFTDAHSQQFLEAVSMQIQDANRSVNYWVTERPSPSHASPHPTSYANFTVTNSSLLPPNISEALQMLEKEYRDGYLTEKGYLGKKTQLLGPFRHLVTTNGSMTFGPRVEGGGGGGGGGGGLQGGNVRANGNNRAPSHVEFFDGSEKGHVGRRLMAVGVVSHEWEVPVEDLQLAEWVAQSKHKELTRERDLKRAVEDWESKHGPWDPTRPLWESRRRLPWERLHVFPEKSQSRGEGEESRGDPYTTGVRRGRKLMDTYADSLRYVNRLLNKAYGYEARKVPAHMPHMINREIMQDLQDRYPKEFEHTSANKLRSSDDMQFAFSYFYFLMSEKKPMDMQEVFQQLDTDNSGILSVRELRTLLAKVSDLPLDLKTVHNFEALLKGCEKEFNGTRPSVDPIAFETHYDPELPLVTLEFTQQCKPLVDKLNATFKSQHKDMYEEFGEDQVTFQMISENASKVMQQLDEVRKNRKKFICLNDNMDHAKEGVQLAKLILLDFYESLYPIPSQFELSHQYRNRFLHISELNEWLTFRNRIQLALQLACTVLLILCVVSLFYGKIVQWKRRLMRLLVSYFHIDRTRPPSV